MCAVSSTYLDTIVWYTSLGPIVGVFMMSPTAQESGGRSLNRRVTAAPISGPLEFSAVCISPTMSFAPGFTFVASCCYCPCDLQLIPQCHQVEADTGP